MESGPVCRTPTGLCGGEKSIGSGGIRRVAKQKMHLEVEDTLEGGRQIGRRKMHWKAEEASEAEAESETERRGIRGFPLHVLDDQYSRQSIRKNHFFPGMPSDKLILSKF